MRVLVVGAGGVGGYFGGRLAANGCDVTFVARGAHLAAIQEHGLRVNSPLGDIHLKNARAVSKIADAGPADMVLVGVKLWDTEAVAVELRSLVSEGASVVSFQNGVQKDDILGRHLRPGHLLGGVCYIAATIEAPSVIRHTGTMQRLIVGDFGYSRRSKAQDFCDACTKAGIDASVSDDIERLIWEKFVFLVGLSASTSVARRSIGEVRQDPKTRASLLDAMHEVVAVGRTLGVELSEDYAEDRLAFCDSLPAGMSSSMAHDLAIGNRLELPWLSGAVVELGKQAKVPTPVNASMYEALAPFMMGRPKS